MSGEPFPWLTLFLIVMVVALIFTYGPRATQDNPICPTTNVYNC